VRAAEEVQSARLGLVYDLPAQPYAVLARSCMDQSANHIYVAVTIEFPMCLKLPLGGPIVPSEKVNKVATHPCTTK